MGTNNTKDSNFQSSLDEAGPFNMNCETSKYEVFKEEMDVKELHLNESSIDTCSNNSDIDADDDDSIINCYVNFCSPEASPRKSIPQSSSSLFASIEFYDTSTLNASCDTTHAMVDIEILEENNNDPNNNLDYIQSFQKQVTCASASKNNIQKAESIKCSNSSISCCSNNSEDTEFKIFDKKLKEEALQICNLLPKFNCESVYKVLYKNRYAKNRIELSLWDLLPNKRPRIERPFKRKFVDNSGFENTFFEESLLIKDFKQNYKQNNYIEQSNKEVNIDDKNITIVHDTLSNDKLNLQNRMNSTNVKNKQGATQKSDENNRLLEHSVTGDDVSLTTRNGILHPAKLVLNHKPPCVEHVTSSNSSILSPSKLTYITAKQLNEENIKPSTCTGKYKNKEFISNKSIPFGRNVFMSNTTNLSADNKSLKDQTLYKYMQYLRYMQNIKKQKLNGKLEQFDCGTQNETRKMFSKFQCTSPALNILHHADAEEVPKTLSVHNANCSNEMTNNSNCKETDTINSSDSVIITDNISATAIFSKPSISAVPETEQVFGGTRRKEIAQKIKNKSSKSKQGVKNNNNVLPLKHQEMYETLVLVFPQMDKDYIKRICKECSVEQLQELIEPTLQNEELYPVEINTEPHCQKNIYDENEQYIYLSGIFPNADSTYLKNVVATIGNDPDAILEFIQTQLEHPTYVTKQEKLRRRKITEQQMQYIMKFDVQQFLKLFPDPFTHFENSNRKCKFSMDALKFLKSYFYQFEDSTLENTYSYCKYHLTNTAQALETKKSTKKSERKMHFWELSLDIEDISLLQEIAFIVHKIQIRKYLDKLKEEETKEFEELKRKNELLECQCCYDNECIPSKCSTCNDGHIFCNSCILQGTESKLAQGDTYITCFTNCDGEFSLPTLQKILSPTQFSIFIRKRQEAEVMAAGLEGLVSCPFCHFASIPPPEDKVFKCLNPECMKESCRLCKELSHIPFKCYEKKSDEARLFLEEKMTEALVRKCYTCGRPYFKDTGCNKVTCSCGTIMCYICDKPVKDYSHFEFTSCPLWSDNNAINTKTVQAVAIKAMEYIKKKDPNVKIDRSGFPIDFPTTSTNLDDYGIPERVRKVTKFDA